MDETASGKVGSDENLITIAGALVGDSFAVAAYSAEHVYHNF